MGIILAEVRMRFEAFSFGSIRIDGTTYEHDVVIDHGQVRKRRKKPSKRFQPPKAEAVEAKAQPAPPAKPQTVHIVGLEDGPREFPMPAR
jgi:hypothetical protein